MIRWILLGCLASGALAQSAAETACGVITSLDGTLTVVDTHGHKAAASLFDWIACNRVLESAPNSHAVVALANGQRFELGPNARLALKPDGAEKISGLVNKLSSMPPMPKLPGIGPEGGSAVRAAAVRLRGQAPFIIFSKSWILFARLSHHPPFLGFRGRFGIQGRTRG
jgi:hypothetical protein